MVGSGLGCLIMLALLGPLTASKMLFLLASLSGITAFLFSYRDEKRIATISIIAAVLLALFVIRGADRIVPIKPAKSKLLADLSSKKNAKIEYSRWHPLYRIDVVPIEDIDRALEPGQETLLKSVTLDGDASTIMYRRMNLDSLRAVYGTQLHK